jgi:hypothetical protein
MSNAEKCGWPCFGYHIPLSVKIEVDLDVVGDPAKINARSIDVDVESFIFGMRRDGSRPILRP